MRNFINNILNFIKDYCIGADCRQLQERLDAEIAKRTTPARRRWRPPSRCS